MYTSPTEIPFLIVMLLKIKLSILTMAFIFLFLGLLLLVLASIMEQAFSVVKLLVLNGTKGILMKDWNCLWQET